MPDSQSPVSYTHLDVHEGLQVSGDAGVRLEEVGGLLDGHVEDVGHGLAVVRDFKGLAVVSFAVADLAVHVDVGQEVHFDLQRAVAVAGLASAAFDVETEAAGAVAAHLGFGSLGEKGADQMCIRDRLWRGRCL